MILDLEAARRQSRSLDHVDHRPWPRPARPWRMAQTWENLLFAHWAVSPDDIRPYVPSELELDTYDGSAWIAITPFRLTNLRARGTLPLPYVASFLELNVRTYVTIDDKPGIWFFSLDASSRLAVEAARRTYRLPYFHARMSATRRDDWIDYACARIDESGRVFVGSYRPTGEAFVAHPGSLEWFLTERYCLYTTDPREQLHRAEIHHDPWPLRAAEAAIELASVSPLPLEGPPLCHFARRQDVVIWPLEPVR